MQLLTGMSRVILECKTAKFNVVQPQPVVIAKFRDAYHADYRVMVGPHFNGAMELSGKASLSTRLTRACARRKTWRDR